MNIAAKRLAEERKNWRRKHPYAFFARPSKNVDGSTNLFLWKCGIPGKKGTPWEGGLYRLNVEFTENYPNIPPRCHFTPPIFHPNVYKTGTVCLSILKTDKGWHPSITIKQILLHLQILLDEPNLKDAAQQKPYEMLKKTPKKYWKKIKKDSRKHPFF